jgi:hypothetical protein
MPFKVSPVWSHAHFFVMVADDRAMATVSWLKCRLDRRRRGSRRAVDHGPRTQHRIRAKRERRLAALTLAVAPARAAQGRGGQAGQRADSSNCKSWHRKDLLMTFDDFIA